MKDILKRFWSKVDIAGKNDCWNWIGAKDRGYGKFGIRVGVNVWRAVYAHRFSYEIINGPIVGPRNIVINHKCNNRSCVNPKHLELVTQAYNVQVGNIAKVSPEQVREIRKLYDAGKYNGKQLAVMFSISDSQTYEIINRNTWENI